MKNDWKLVAHDSLCFFTTKRLMYGERSIFGTFFSENYKTKKKIKRFKNNVCNSGKAHFYRDSEENDEKFDFMHSLLFLLKSWLVAATETSKKLSPAREPRYSSSHRWSLQWKICSAFTVFDIFWIASILVWHLIFHSQIIVMDRDCVLMFGSAVKNSNKLVDSVANR